MRIDRRAQHLNRLQQTGISRPAAQDLLENTGDTIERIAILCGFGSARQMRTRFTRISHVTPHAYQRTFRSRTAA
jgi:transcriptional regulator GlxA family with amidase domain